MTISILDDCLRLKDQSPEKLIEYLHSINLQLFDEIFRAEPNLQEAKQIVLFLLCAYSEDSPMVIMRQDSREEQNGICEYLGIPEWMRHKLLHLEGDHIRVAATDYLTQFAGPLFRALRFLDIQLDDLNLAITNRRYVITKEPKAGEEATEQAVLYDWKEHSKATQQYELLSRKKDALEKQIKAQVKRLEGIEDMKKYTREAQETGKLKGSRRGNVESVIKH